MGKENAPFGFEASIEEIPNAVVEVINSIITAILGLLSF